MSRKKRSLFLLAFGLLVTGLWAQKTASTGAPPKLTGEWAVEWEDPKKNETEIIYIWFVQKNGVLSGSALDPNLIAATISGEIKESKLTFDVDPQDGDGWAAAPTSRFKGRLTSVDTMEGRWMFSLLDRGSWKAWRTHAVTPTVTATPKTVVPIRFTPAEHKLLLANMDHDSRRVGDEIEVLNRTVEGWLYNYRMGKSWLREYPGASPPSEVARSARAKIIRALNAHGYPWTKIPE